MEMMDDRVVFVDTNVLLSATTPERSLHRAALVVLNEWPNQGQVLALSVQVLREYLVVATRPIDANGLGLSAEDASANVSAFRSRMRGLFETESTLERLLRWVSAGHCQGKQIHDANLVAVALGSGIHRLITANTEDFVRFTPEIEVIALSGLSPA